MRGALALEGLLEVYGQGNIFATMYSKCPSRFVVVTKCESTTC
jgi:hypothetical protein